MSIPSDVRERLLRLWGALYGDSSSGCGGSVPGDGASFEELVSMLERYAARMGSNAVEAGGGARPLRPEGDAEWFREAAVYCAYVDLFAGGFAGFASRLDHLTDLGVDTLWLLPILDSPMRDMGFDVRDYLKVRPELEADGMTFEEFLGLCSERGFRVIFDVPLNHCSDEHPAFVESASSREGLEADSFIWRDDDKGYALCRKLFKGLVDSNWEYHEGRGQYYFHRFYPFQPDWNYRNPAVLLRNLEVLLEWRRRGVAGFRLDAVPYLWKEEGTNCENLPGTHTIVKMFRAALDYAAPGTFLLAEACQPPAEVAAYFGEGDECHAAYHFPLMPMLYLAMARGDCAPVVETLDESITPSPPDGCGWFTFLRCHDEFTLEMVTEDQRRELYSAYCHRPEWDFRKGEGISARLAELFRFDPDRILLAWFLLLSLPGTPVVFYGDEVAKPNDEEYYERMTARTGYGDSRFLVRGKMDWDWVGRVLSSPGCVSAQVYDGLRRLLHARRGSRALTRGTLEFLRNEGPLFAALRRCGGEMLLCAADLAGTGVELKTDALPAADGWSVLCSRGASLEGNVLRLAPHGWVWSGCLPHGAVL